MMRNEVTLPASICGVLPCVLPMHQGEDHVGPDGEKFTYRVCDECGWGESHAPDCVRQSPLPAEREPTRREHENEIAALRVDLKCSKRERDELRSTLDCVFSEKEELLGKLRETRAALRDRHELCDLPGVKRCVLVKGHGGSMCCSNSQTMWPSRPPR